MSVVNVAQACIVVVQECETRGTGCFAVDYDNAFHQCWLFSTNADTAGQGCDDLSESPFVYHVKKDLCREYSSSATFS